MINITMTAVPLKPPPDAIRQARARFMHVAESILVRAVQEVLGTDEVYTLTPRYRSRKRRLDRFQQLPGKSLDQPLILTGEMYSDIQVEAEGDSLTMSVGPQGAVAQAFRDAGFDYEQYWQERTDFLGIGADKAIEPLADYLVSVALDALYFGEEDDQPELAEGGDIYSLPSNKRVSWERVVQNANQADLLSE